MPKGIPKNKEEKKEVNLEDKVMALIDKIREGTDDRRFSITAVYSHLLQSAGNTIKNLHDLQDIFLALEKKKLIYNVGGTLWTTLRVRKIKK